MKKKILKPTLFAFFTCFGNNKSQVQNFTTEKKKAVRVLDPKAVETTNIESNTA